MAESFKEKTTQAQQDKCFALCAYFNHSSYYRVEVLDCNEKGILIKAKTPVKPGAVLIVREMKQATQSYTDSRMAGALPSVATGEVMQCEQLLEGDGKVAYDIGIKYLIPSV